MIVIINKAFTRQRPRVSAAPAPAAQLGFNAGASRHVPVDAHRYVVLRIRAALTALGVRTAMSRGNDDALGPCVDQRAAMANALQPDAMVSIHADGGPPDGQGFHVNYSSPPLNAAQAGPAVRFGQVMRDQVLSAGLQPSTYRGPTGCTDAPTWPV